MLYRPNLMLYYSNIMSRPFIHTTKNHSEPYFWFLTHKLEGKSIFTKIKIKNPH